METWLTTEQQAAAGTDYWVEAITTNWPPDKRSMLTPTFIAEMVAFDIWARPRHETPWVPPP